MATPGPGWRVDAFMYEAAEDKGVLFLAWHGRETRVRYADALRQDSTPWHGWLVVSPYNSQVLPWAVKQQWTRTVYFDFGGEEDKVKPTYLGLDSATDFFMGIDSDGGRIGLVPLTFIGVGLEYGGARADGDGGVVLPQVASAYCCPIHVGSCELFWRRARM